MGTRCYNIMQMIDAFDKAIKVAVGTGCFKLININ